MSISNIMARFMAVVAALTLFVQAHAQTADASAKPESSSVKAELQTIIQQIRDKMKSSGGKLTADDLAPQIKAFDDILAKHASEKTDDVVQVAFMKATLYSEVLNDKKTGDALMEKLKTDYKGTPFVVRLEKQEAAGAEAKKRQAALAPGAAFPDFTEKDLAGKPLSVGNLKGKVVLVDFWATWCGPCVHELPNVLSVYKANHDKGFEIIGVSLDSEREKLDAFLKKTDGMTWSQYFDGKGWGNKLAEQYGVQSIPFTVLIGKDGKIIDTSLRGEALAPAVVAALAK